MVYLSLILKYMYTTALKQNSNKPPEECGLNYLNWHLTWRCVSDTHRTFHVVCVVGSTPPGDTHIQIPNEYTTLHVKKTLQRRLSWVFGDGRWSWLSQVGDCHLKGPYKRKREAGGPESEPGRCCAASLKMGRGLGLRTTGVSKSWKGQGVGSRWSPRRKQACDTSISDVWPPKELRQ